MWNYELAGGNDVGTLVIFFAALAATFAAARVTQTLFRGRLKTMAEDSKSKFDDIILTTFEKPIYWIVLAGGLSLTIAVLQLPEGLKNLVDHLITLVVVTFAAWSASNFITALRLTYIDPIIDRSESRLDDQIIPIIERSLKVAIWSFSALIAFDNIGFDIVSLLTGLGIGGLALAMAAKDTLANVFGSLTIFTDRPFQVDDVVTLQGHTGTVTDLGLRTCRLRTFDGTVVTVPNSLLVGNTVENVSARTARKHSATLGLVYTTTTEQLEAAIQALKNLLSTHESVRDDFAVRFTAFGDSALEVSLSYWVEPPGKFFDVVSELNLRIKRTFDENGWDMAFPSMTIYKQ
jgi:MscS family membrane protein